MHQTCQIYQLSNLIKPEYWYLQRLKDLTWLSGCRGALTILKREREKKPEISRSQTSAFQIIMDFINPKVKHGRTEGACSILSKNMFSMLSYIVNIHMLNKLMR